MRTSSIRRLAVATLSILLIGSVGVSLVEAATTLLVNTESFSVIDSGDGSTSRELRFGTSDITILYNISQTRFEINRALLIRNSLTATGSISAKDTLSGSKLYIQNNAEIRGALVATGAIRTDSNITINDDADTNDAILNFGNQTANQTLKYLNTAQKFQFSKGLSVIGHLSGSTLQVDGNASFGGSLSATGSIKTKGTLSGSSLYIGGTTTLRNVNYQFPSTQGGANTFLKNDGAGNLSWTTTSVGNGSGNILSLHPEYPNAVYFSSGSTAVGQMAVNYDTTNKENYYRWTSTKGVLHDYWIALRIRVPDNFSSWDPIKPIELRYRTGQASAAANYLQVKMLDTAGNPVTLTGGGGLANTSWTTANITGPQGAGTFTAKQYFTVWIKMASDSTGSADAGFINFNIETTTP